MQDFHAFAGEEQDLSNSRANSEQVLNNALDIKFVINLDEIGIPMMNGISLFSNQLSVESVSLKAVKYYRELQF